MNNSPYGPNNFKDRERKPFSKPGESDSSELIGLEGRFQRLPGWQRFGLISLTGLIFIGMALFLCVLVANAFAQ
jgi:hypothetical protein